MIDEARVFKAVSRATSALSIVCTVFILFTFAAFPCFRKPINRLVVYASVGNILCNIATIISVSGIPTHGGNMGICRFQGFFMQMFMPADSMWTLSMALNVYLTFFCKYDANDLRALELRYVAINYGLPFIPAVVYLILDKSPLHAGLYGPAGLWCWISADWEWVRFAFFYTPIWLIISAIICIYVRTGKVIFQQRAALRSVSNMNRSERSYSDPPIPVLETGKPFIANSQNRIRRVTATEVFPEDAAAKDANSMTIEHCKDPRNSFSSTRHLSPSPHVLTTNKQAHCAYSTQPTAPNQWCNPAIWRFSAVKETNQDLNKFYATTAVPTGPLCRELQEPPLADSECLESTTLAGKWKQRHARYGPAKDAAWAYAKVAFLMFVGLFIVWIPATINRVYSLVHSGQSNFAIAVSVAAVAPLQGFWNWAIYVATSWSQCRDAWQDTKEALTGIFESTRIRKK